MNYENLDWQLLIKILSDNCQSQEAQKKLLDLKPNLTREAILARWAIVCPLKELFSLGYRAPIGDIQPVDPLIKKAILGGILEGGEIRIMYSLIEAVERVRLFSKDFSQRCSSLEAFQENLRPHHTLKKDIERSIDKDGSILDAASDELSKIRSLKSNLRKKIINRINQIIRDKNWDLFLQDDFFTVRSDRFVIPIKLAGRGKVPGTIVDTSSSGQTIYIEPNEVASLNQNLQDLELSEKLEMIRILRDFSLKFAQINDEISSNYQHLIDLDMLSAEAQLADELQANQIQLTDEPKINLKAARHPLIVLKKDTIPVANDIIFLSQQNSLIISGPNAGGKTVVLKTFGLILLLTKSGLLPPVDVDSELYLFENLYIEMGDSQNLSANLSTFSGHLAGIKNILQHACSQDLVLFDELAVGTEPITGASLAQAVLEKLSENRVTTLTTTHFENLKNLAFEKKTFRNASMEYSLTSLRPTYKLMLDIPGQSYGLELAENIGLSEDIIARSKELRGKDISNLDLAVQRFSQAREESERAKKDYEKSKETADISRAKWDQEVKLIEKIRANSASKLQLKYDNDISKYQLQLESLLSEFKKDLKKFKSTKTNFEDTMQEGLLEKKNRAKSILKDYRNSISDLTQMSHSQVKLPGKEVPFDELRVGDNIYIVPLGKKGNIKKVGKSVSDKIIVEVGLLVLKVDCKDVRKITNSSVNKKKKDNFPKSTIQLNSKKLNHVQDHVSTMIKTSENTLDVRGFKLDEALDKVWRFVDLAILRSFSYIYILHGHGSGSLKNGIRNALSKDGQYTLSFKPGDKYCGGDGVTVVYFEV